MYVCVCKAVTDKQVNKAIANGQCTRRQLADSLGVGKSCGKCVKQVNQLIDANISLLNSVTETLKPVFPQPQHAKRAQKEVKEAICLEDLLVQPSMA